MSCLHAGHRDHERKHPQDGRSKHEPQHHLDAPWGKLVIERMISAPRRSWAAGKAAHPLATACGCGSRPVRRSERARLADVEDPEARGIDSSKPRAGVRGAGGGQIVVAGGIAIDASMTIQRMDNVGIVVDDLPAAIAFFVELGLELEGETTVEGPWVDRIVGLDGVRVDIAMMRTPDGHSRLELMKFHTPRGDQRRAEDAPANTLGIRRIMFAVDDIDDVLARLRAHGAELIGEVAQYEDSYRLCYLRGPEGIIVALAQQLS